MRKLTGCYILLAIFFSFFSQCAFSKCCPPPARLCPRPCGYFEFTAGYGSAQLNTGSPTITIPNLGTIKLERHRSQVGDATVGVAYVFPLVDQPYSNYEIAWLPTFSTQLNFHHISRNLVSEYRNRSNPNHHDYDLSLNNNRVMIDFALTLFTLQRFSLYAIGGGGEAVTRVSYDQRPNPDVIGANIKLNNRNNNGFASELGGGATLNVNNNFSVSLQYLYTNFYNVRTSQTGTLSGMPIRLGSTEFPFHAQEVFLLFTVK